MENVQGVGRGFKGEKRKGGKDGGGRKEGRVRKGNL